MKKHMYNTFRVKHIVVLFLVMVFTFSFSPFFVEGTLVSAQYSIETEILEFEGDFDWETTLDVQTSSSDYITYDDFRDTYCKAANTASECASAASGKYIRFDTAEELYRWSVDVSYELIYETGVPAEDVKLADDVIDALLSLDYVLGKNIDYSIMESKAFIPIGYAFTDLDLIDYERSFSGTFDGQGFEIENLYVTGYDNLIFIDYTEILEEVDIALSEHYSMFAYNEGTIENLGLVDPNLEILELHIDITKLSNLVGFNMSTGVVQNVYVYDTRTDVTEAGIRYNVGTSSSDFEAAGIVHTNQGTFTSAYYVSPVVVNGYYINKISAQPVLYTNTGTISNLVYDGDVYKTQVSVSGQTFYIDTPNGNALYETTATLMSDSSSLSLLTHQETYASGTETLNVWYFYYHDDLNYDGYPLLRGFEWDSSESAYQIFDEVDLQFFSDVLSFETVDNGSSYDEADYLIMNSLDMSVLAPGAYEIPEATFYGELSGENALATDLGDNYYIYNLDITEGILRGEDYEVGLFSVLGAGAFVHDLNFSQSSIVLSNTDDYYSKEFFIGAIAGKMTGGTIENILVDVDIDLGTDALGKTYAGGVVGKASGVINYVSNFGDLDANDHVFNASYNIEPLYYIGGIVGAAEAAKLTLEEVVNQGNIYGFETSSTITLESGVTDIQVYIGGVIGYINSTLGSEHELINVANRDDTGSEANIYINEVVDSVGVPSTQYVGGVFGMYEGVTPVLEASSEYLFANLYNSGLIHHTYTANTADIYAAGIGINNASEAIEYALLFNHEGYDFTEGSATYTQTQFNYAALIYDISSYAVTISRSYNYADFSFSTDIWDEISPLYISDNDNATQFNFVANFGDIDYLNNSGNTQIDLVADTYITGITLESNVDYLNTYMFGDINVVNLDVNSYDLFVAGFTYELADTHYIKNSLSDSDIKVAEIDGSGNIYISGIVNINNAGDLHDAGQSETQPIATEGIIDTINSGDISTSYGAEVDGLYGINGTSNTFIGGLATLNAGSIQDAGNLGDIGAYNSYASSTFTYETSSYYAGLVTNYTAGIAAGGVSAVVISGDSRIYDTANNGNVIVATYKYVRAGGVLGVALYEEADAGGITSAMGLTDDIEDSILSNGMNLGNISAISNSIGNYSTSSTTTGTITVYENSPYISGVELTSVSTTVGTSERPTIYSSAGGVIGYGLSYMQRMLNHGNISATDVAGGVVGATYVLGGSSSTTTTVNITTAINYGDIDAVDNGDFSSINKYEMSYSDVSSNFMSEAEFEAFVYPTGFSPMFPAGKRGFGGIFGRLQRGLNGVMSNDGGAFDFIVNANEDIDLIGRLDQVNNFSSSGRFFRFNDAIYYSAKLDDTTQTVFTGFRLGYNYSGTITSVNYSTNTVYADYDGYIMYQVGYTNEYQYESGTVYEGYYRDTSPGSVGSTSQAGFIGPIEVPWITEDPTDPNITDADSQYMYDDDFPMRTNSELTEYIYYMTNDLLASRFTTARPNGMYVLSTTAGESFGLVLPRNIDISNIRQINEDYTGFITLLTDYSTVSPIIQTDFSTAVEDGFEDLKQTTFNDKAEIVPSDTTDVVLTEDGGSSNILAVPTVDYVNMELTYTISVEAFTPAQVTADFLVTAGLVSSGALIAITPDDYYGYAPTNTELEAFNNLLYPERNNLISTSYPADLSVTIPSRDITVNQTLSIGTFTVFAEAFMGDDLYAKSTYYNTYEVFIEFTPGSDYLAGTTEIEDVEFNGGSSVAVADPVADVYDLTALGDVNTTGSITLYIEDTKGVLSQGYDFSDNFVIKYTDGTTVDSAYYTVSYNAVNIVSTIGYYDITFTFLDGTVSGNYYFEYSYFPTSTVFTVNFDKAASSENDIISFEYYSDQGSVSIVGNAITSYINIGYPLDDYMDVDLPYDDFTSTTNTGLDSYLSNITYDIDFFTAGTLEISQFASVFSARLVQTTITDGYKTYQLEYIIEAEDGTQSVYTHYLIERDVDLVSVLKDGNNVQLSDIHVDREAEDTEFTVDLGFDQNLNLYVIEAGAYSYLEIVVSGTTNDGLTTYTSGEIVGLTYTATDYLYINMSYETLPGIYTFEFTYYRDGSMTDFVTYDTDLVIEKDLGTDAYLTDIKFSDVPSETTYPDIYLTDSSGEEITSSYNPVVYFNGIDYDGADEAEWPYYQVDGAVNNIPLNSYMPYMLDYLPYGATISRQAYGEISPGVFDWYWTDEADANSDNAIITQLSTDFTVYPDTGLEPAEGDMVEIIYRVTAEDGLTTNLYYITVTDITFNLTVVFDIYYCTGVGEETCTLADESVDFDDELIILTVKNLDTDGNANTASSDDPEDFPTFTTVNDLNNRIQQFYYISDADYNYKFGRNMSGFYTFEIELQLDQYLNDIYEYEIKYGDYYLNDASDYITDLTGKYYYIGPSITMRTRRFNIYIREVENPSTDTPYGLFDFFKSWFYD